MDGEKLIARELKTMDEISDIFEICKENKMLSSYYATSNEAWDFLYRNNPNKKSWNTILTDDKKIFGHSGIHPFSLKVFSNKVFSGGLSNVVISKLVRKKMLPYKNKNTFPVIPLMDSCCQAAFRDNVQLIFAYTSIHPMIMKSLNFKTINLKKEITIHANLTNLYKFYFEQSYARYGKKKLRVFVRWDALLLMMINIIPKFYQKIIWRMERLNGRMKIVKFDDFDFNFSELFAKFNTRNDKIITFDRSVEYLNWRFKGNNFLKYKIIFKEQLVGYLLLEKIESDKVEKYSVIDYIILNEYLKSTNAIFNYLIFDKKITIIYEHYISCDYVKKIFKMLLKHTVDLKSLLNFKKNIGNIQPFFYRINDVESLSVESLDMLEKSTWHISPIFFTPTYNKKL